MSYCELCGHQTFEKKMVVVDDTIFNVCIKCSKRGKPYVPPQIAIKKKKPFVIKPQNKIKIADETILTPNFARLIREARMKMGLTHEQLGMKMNEKAQLLKKLETGSLKPDEIFAKKLERYLGIKLYVSTNSNEE
ncbi:MAG: multiprotein-bridging factor 1 family protein [Thermoproteota archaeon]|jgi:putative transcription factor|nr:multiprotein-bridging factor 1 family protein [Thermoproteota archaeon]